MAGENEFLLHALLTGVFITFIYDVIRIFRRVVPHRDFFVSLEDLVFWIYCGGLVFLLMYHESDGKLRWFAVFGALAGMMIYKKLVSRILVKYVSSALCTVLEQTGRFLIWLLRPVRFLIRRMGSGLKKACRGVRRALRGLRRTAKTKLTYFLRMLKIGLKN